MNSEYWKETKKLFSNIIEKPPLEEKFLKRPPPKYIFNLIINTMRKTGFPKGLFTLEEENVKYFLSDINHKKQFLNKVIDITKIVTNATFDINTENILKGLEAEKTNIFIQHFYKAATLKINTKPIIDKYLNDIKIKENIKEEPNEKKQIIGYIFWIDKNVYNEENNNYLNSFKQNSRYKQLDLPFYCFENLEEPFELIKNYLSFKLVFIIISGSLYPDYYYKLKEQIKFIKCLPICIIFTSDYLKDILLKKKIKYYFTEEILDTINDSFYNLGGVSSDFDSCLKFIFNIYIGLQNKFKIEEIEKTSYDGCITFEYIYNQSQLLLPFLYNELRQKVKVSDNEIQLFKNFLLINHREEKIVNMILPMLYIKEIPHDIITKYFLRIYTEKTPFYSEMNKLLMKQYGKYYKTYIDVMYEGILNNSISISEDDYLYRGSKMSKKEIDDIMKKFEEWKQKQDKSFPSFLLYSRCFLSFSKDKDQIDKFLENKNDSLYSVVFILKNNYNINNKFTSNADIEFLSAFTKEREVLFFPFSTFCLEKINKGEYKQKKCVIINLEYLGKYNKIFENITKDVNFENKFIEVFNSQNYSKEIVKSKILEPNISDMDSAKKILFEKIKELINEKYKIEIKGEINEEKNPIENMYAIKMEEKNINKKEKRGSIKEIILDYDLINLIHEKYKIKEEENKKGKEQDKKNKIRYFFLTSFKLKKMEYIWNGSFNKENKKNEFGKEYDFDDNIVFEGEYINGIKIKGIEYYIIGTKKYEGDYKDGKRWNGVLYDRNMKHQYELKLGKGFIKEFHENGCLSFEGDINNGEKTGKGKFYDEWGHLIFEGHLDNGIKNGMGKMYNFSGDLVFEGEFKNGQKFKGNIYIFNNQSELIYKEEDGKNKNLQSEDSYENDIMIKNNIWIMRKKKNKLINNIQKFESENKVKKRHKEKKYNIYGELILDENYKEEKNYNGNEKEYDYDKLIFEGEYKDGKKYKGKEYNVYGELIFEGEYKDGKRYKGKEYNGNLIFEGEYKDEKRYNGKEYNYYNELIFEGEYKDRKRYKGKEYNNGILIFEGEYKDGKRYKGKGYDKGELIFEGEYKDEKIYKGKTYIFHDKLIIEGIVKGLIKANKIIKVNNSIELMFIYFYLNKKFYFYYSNGKFIDKKEINNEEELYYFGNYENKKKNGYGQEYDKFGKLLFNGNYINGNKNKGREYLDNKLIFYGEYKEGKQWSGIKKEYNDNGKLIFEGEYKDGKKNKGKNYNDHGELIFEGEYKDGKKNNGHGKEFNYNGELIFEGEFKDGKKYKGKKYENGKLVFEGEYKDGKIYKGNEFNYNGKLIFEGEFKGGKKWNGILCNPNDNNYSGELFNGIGVNIKEYNDNNELIFEGEYKNGQKYKGREYENGKLVFEGEYKEGQRYKGKKFNDINQLIFEGEYKDGKIYNGTEYNYYDKMQFEFEYKFGKQYKSIFKHIKFNELIGFEDEFQDGIIFLGQEYIYSILKFEGEYKDRKRYKGKEYDNGILIFEGEYKDGKRYKGKEYNIYDKLDFIFENKDGKINVAKDYYYNTKLIYKNDYEGIIKLSFEGEYNNGEKCNGFVRIYNYNDDIIFEGKYEKENNEFNENIRNKILQFKSNTDDGESIVKGKEYNYIGEVIFEGKFREGKRYKGMAKEYNRFGQIIFQGEYKNKNKFYGKEYYTYDIFGNIFEGEFQNNKKYKGKEYNKYGELIFEGEYRNEERWNGLAFNNCSQFFYVDGEIEGNIITYDYMKHELFEGEYKNGEQFNGKLKTYFDDINHILKREVEIKNGEIEGDGKEYYGNKRLKYLGTYKNGKPNGYGTLYYEFCGHIKYIGEFKNGMKDGEGKEFDKNGNLVYEGRYSEDKRI